MLLHWQRIRQRVRAYRRGASSRRSVKSKKDHWRTVRRRQFLRQYMQALEIQHECEKCHGPVSEVMRSCPWCGRARRVHKQAVRFPLHCPRCRRGLKSDWRYCPWCHGPAIGPATERRYGDRRYQARCPKRGCPRKDLMPFMRYCPWCRTKVQRAWKIAGTSERCRSCGWGVLSEFWDHCPWCSKPVGRRKG
jgi:hypothetical protein